MSEDADDRTFLWLWTWIFVAVSSAGYAMVNLITSTPGEAAEPFGVLKYLVEVVLPIGMCALAAWLGFEEWRSAQSTS